MSDQGNDYRELVEALGEVSRRQEHLEKAIAAKSPRKDFWDKFSSFSVFFSSVIMAVFAAYVSSKFDAAQTNIARAQTRINELASLERFIPHFTSGNTQEEEAAIVELSAFGETPLAAEIATLYQDQGTHDGLLTLVANGDPSQQMTAAKALEVPLATRDFPSSATCPLQGSGGDANLNRLKNRWVAPSSLDIAPSITKPSDLTRLPQLGSGYSTLRDEWPNDSFTGKISVLERKAVTVQGYLIRARREGPETVNCESRSLHDYHLYVTDRHDASSAESVIAEMTPRWIALYPSWTGGGAGYETASIDRLRGQEVRITGWLLYDQEHWDMVDRGQRATPWEIHPVTNVQYLSVRSGKPEWRML